MHSIDPNPSETSNYKLIISVIIDKNGLILNKCDIFNG